MKQINYLGEFWEYVETQKDKTKIGKAVYDWLDRDNLSSILSYGGVGDVYYTELTCSYCTMPNFIHSYIKSYMKREHNILNMYDVSMYDYMYDVSMYGYPVCGRSLTEKTK